MTTTPAPHPDDDNLLTKQELARRLNLSPTSVEKLMGLGLPTRRFPGLRAVRFSLPDVERWLSDVQGVRRRRVR